MESQYLKSIHYLSDLNREFEGYFRKRSIDELHALKKMTLDFINGDLDSEQLKTYLRGLTVALLKKGKQQQLSETEEDYKKRIKHLSSKVADLWLNDIRAKQRRISDITDSKDRIKKLIQILIADNYSAAHNSPAEYPLPWTLIGDLKSSTSINNQLHTSCSQITDSQLTELENYEPYFSASFTDKDFIHFLEQKAQQPGSITHLHTKQISCIYNSITHLDSFRIHTEMLGRQDLERSQSRYKEVINEYNKHIKKLDKIKKNLAGINSPKQAKIKEFITQQGFAINAKTGVDILLSARGQTVEKGIKRIIKTTEKETFRRKDKQTEKNFPIYDFLNTKLNPCDFIEHKTDTINNLVNDFLVNETAAEIIASNKDLEYRKSKRQVSVRVPKPTVTAFEKLADDNNITQQLLLNIIIQHSAESILSSGEGYYKAKQARKAAEAQAEKTKESFALIAKNAFHGELPTPLSF